LLRKWTVSSTTMPREVAETVAAAIPTCFTRSAHTPKVMRIGTALGMRLRAPMEMLRRASISTMAIRATARALPLSMLSMLRWEMRENITAAPVGSACMWGGVWARSQAVARSRTRRVWEVEISPTVAVTRVADLSMLIRSFKSRP
jgi:hypothetical protein